MKYFVCEYIMYCSVIFKAVLKEYISVATRSSWEFYDLLLLSYSHNFQFSGSEHMNMT